MKKIFVYKIAFAVAAICSIIFLFKSCGNRQNISGTVIAKSGDIKSRYKSTRIYTEYIFAIHPDDSRFSDFDIEVPLHRYIKDDVGDKVVFYDEDINKYLKHYFFLAFKISQIIKTINMTAATPSKIKPTKGKITIVGSITS